MRVCHVLPAYPDDARGHREGQNYRQLLRRLAGGGTACVAVTARQYRDSPTAEADGDVAVRRFVFGDHDARLGDLPLTPARAFRYRRAGVAMVCDVNADAPVDILHAHTPVPCGLVALAAGRRLRVPVVLTLHGSDMLVHPQRSGVVRLATRWVLKRADRVLAVAEHLADAARDFAPHVAVDVIPIGYDDSLFAPGVPADAREPVAVSTRNLAPIYRLDTLIDAAHALGNESVVNVQVFGEGPDRDALERAAQGAPVTFAGFAEPPMLARTLQHVAVYVSTAESDGTSVSLLEAMACGAYPIVTDIAANRRWIDDGQNGRLVPTGDAPALAEAIAEAWTDAGARQRAAALNGTRVHDAAWSVVVPRLQDIYASVTDAPGMG